MWNNTFPNVRIPIHRLRPTIAKVSLFFFFFLTWPASIMLEVRVRKSCSAVGCKDQHKRPHQPPASEGILMEKPSGSLEKPLRVVIILLWRANTKLTAEKKLNCSVVGCENQPKSHHRLASAGVKTKLINIVFDGCDRNLPLFYAWTARVNWWIRDSCTRQQWKWTTAVFVDIDRSYINVFLTC